MSKIVDAIPILRSKSAIANIRKYQSTSTSGTRLRTDTSTRLQESRMSNDAGRPRPNVVQYIDLLLRTGPA